MHFQPVFSLPFPVMIPPILLDLDVFFNLDFNISSLPHSDAEFHPVSSGYAHIVIFQLSGINTYSACSTVPFFDVPSRFLVSGLWSLVQCSYTRILIYG
jgi:hypothetical protein